MSVKISSLNTASTINSGDDINIAGNNPLYFSDWGGGWYMMDGTWIRSYNAKSLWIGAGVIGGDGGLTIGYGGTSYGTNNAIIAGLVGIGTSTPATKLQVVGGYISTKDDAAYGGAFMEGYNGIVYFGSLGTDNISLYSSGDRLFINGTSGNVGIGTTIPTQKLHVAGNIVLGSTANGYQEAGSKYIGLSYPSLGTDGYVGFQFESVNAPAPYNGNYSQNIKFYTHHYGSGTGGTPRLTIQYDGNVGIGTSTPTGKLEILGNDNQLILNTAGTYSSIYFRNNGISVGQLFSTNAATYLTTIGSRILYLGGGNGVTQITLDGTNVGIGTGSPEASLDNQGAAGTYRQRDLTTMVTNTLSASGTQAKRFEIARISIDYNDWNIIGAVEIELCERYYSKGLKKKYSVYYGYVSSSGANLIEMSGSGDNQFQVTLGAEVVIGGDIRYIPIYVDVNYYSKVNAIVKTTRGLTTSNPPGAGGIWLNNNPTGTDIASFTADSLVYVGNIIGGNSTFSTGNLLVGTTTDAGFKLDVNGTARVSASGGVFTLSSTSNDVWQTFAPQTGDVWRIQARTSSQFGVYNETLGVFPFTLASTGAATFSSSVTASSIIKSGGTSAQFLKADGSIDSNTYITSGALAAYLPLAGGTLTGTLIGTTIRARKSQADADYTTAAIWTESFSATTTGIAFHINNNVGKFLEMRTNGILYWDNSVVITSNRLTLNYDAAPISADSVTQNQLGYVNGNISLFGQTDGGLYSSAYSSSWIHQIFGDFRTGQIAVRGKSSNTWGAWRIVLDSTNYTSYAPAFDGTGASGTWGIDITGNAATADALTSMDISQFTNDSGYVTSGALSAYLPTTGGTLTGGLNLYSANPQLTFTDTTAGEDDMTLSMNGDYLEFLSNALRNIITIQGETSSYAGNVGIGRPDPAYKLDVDGRSRFNGIIIGRGAGDISTNVGLGANPLFSNTSGYENTAVGYLPMYNNTIGIRNTALGNNALYSNTTGSSNVAIGAGSLYSNIDGRYNSSVGYNSMQFMRGEYNSALGRDSMRGSLTAANNTGQYNTAVGYESMIILTSGQRNTALGYGTGGSLSTGSRNTFIGVGASQAAGGIVTTGNNNTIIGGYGGTTTLSDTVVLADGSGQVQLWATGKNVAFGTTSPTTYANYTTLHIAGQTTTAGGVLRLTTSDSSTAVNIYTNNVGVNYDATTGHSHRFNVSGDTKLTVDGDGITTADPGSGAVPWKLGNVQNEAVALVTNQYIEVEINGSYYRLALVEPA